MNTISEQPAVIAAIIGTIGVGIIILIVWSLFWKGLALWHAARKGNTGWFVACLLVNSCGILEIIYLFLILKLRIRTLFSK